MSSIQYECVCGDIQLISITKNQSFESRLMERWMMQLGTLHISQPCYHNKYLLLEHKSRKAQELSLPRIDVFCRQRSKRVICVPKIITTLFPIVAATQERQFQQDTSTTQSLPTPCSLIKLSFHCLDRQKLGVVLRGFYYLPLSCPYQSHITQQTVPNSRRKHGTSPHPAGSLLAPSPGQPQIPNRQTFNCS